MSSIGTTALPIVKARLNRIGTDTSIDTLLTAIIAAAESEIENESGVLDSADPLDLMLLIDCSVWQYQSRDKSDGMPRWLQYKRRQRFNRIRGVAT